METATAKAPSILANMTEAMMKSFTHEIDAPKCEFCGRELKPNKFFNTMKGKFTQCGWIACDCEGAKQAEQQRLEVEKLEKERELNKKRDRIMQNAGVGLRYIHAKTTNCAKLADRIQDEKSNLFIHGNVGSGKTFLASAILRELAFKGTCKFTYFNTLINDLMRYHDETAGNLMNSCKKCSFLVIDDIGKENMSDFVVSQIFELFNERNANMRPVIVTSNYTIDELGKRLASKGNDETAQAIISRITDNCHMIKLQHADRRKTRDTKD